MGKDTLPLAFGPGQLEYIQVGPWYEKLQANKDAYKDCFVRTYTRVKNLGSKYMHEYCQFIVEDRSTGERARIYVERMNEKDVDVVSLGRDEKKPRNWDELPLPLTSLSFDDPSKMPSLFDVAKIVAAVSVIGGGYKFYGNNCFWYAFTTFDTLRLAFPATLKNWLWVNPGGKEGGSFGDAWGLGFPTMFKYFFRSSADKFDKDRKDNMNWLQPIDDRDEITPEDFVKKLSGHLLEAQSVSAYQEWAQMLGVDVNKEDLEHAISSAESKTKELDQKGELAWTEDFDGAVYDLIEKALSDPDMDKFLAKYDAQPKEGYLDVDIENKDASGSFKAIDAVRGDEVTNPTNQLDLVPHSDANEKLVKALKVIVGSVLTQTGFGKA